MGSGSEAVPVPVSQTRGFWILMGYALVLGVLGAVAGLVFLGVTGGGNNWYDLSDPRWTFGRELIVLTPDAARPEPQKIGVGSTAGWCALIRGGTIFMKRTSPDPSAEYPDRGSTIEIFTAGDYLELETLGPLRLLAPGGSATHVERWDLFAGVDLGNTEASRAAVLRALARTA